MILYETATNMTGYASLKIEDAPKNFITVSMRELIIAAADIIPEILFCLSDISAPLKIGLDIFDKKVINPVEKKIRKFAGAFCGMKINGFVCGYTWLTAGPGTIIGMSLICK